MKPKALDRYIFSQFLPYFIVSLVFFTSVFLTHELLDIIDFIVNYEVGIASVLLMLAYSMPYFLGYVIPIATMIAVLLAFLRISGDNEIIALRSSGISLYRLLYPVIIFCLGTSLLTALVTIWMLPRGKTALEAMTYQVVTSSPALGLKEQEFINNFNNITLYISALDKKNNTLSGVFIQDRQTTDEAVTISAPAGNFIFDAAAGIFRLILTDGVINQVDLMKKTFQSIRFDRYSVNMDLQRPARKAHHKDEREMTFTELRQFLKSGDKSHKDYFPAQLEFYKKFSIPFACVVLGILAVPLGVRTQGARKSSGVGLALVCFLVYYLFLSAGEVLAEKGLLTAAAGMWLPNMVMAWLALYLMIGAARDRNIWEQWQKIRGWLLPVKKGASV